MDGKIGTVAPEWTFAPSRTADDPIFDEASTPALRMLALAGAPFAFKRRNIVTPSVDRPLALGAGRPATSGEEKRLAIAELQLRFRQARRKELLAPRKQVFKRAKARSGLSEDWKTSRR